MTTHPPTTCAHCGTTMPAPTGRASRKRYCTDGCRKTAWWHRHHDDPADSVRGDPNQHLAPAVPAAAPNASRDAVPTPGGQHHCPHCRQPLAIISVVIPADAAIIRPPEVHHDRAQQR